MRLVAFEPDIAQNLGAMIRISACMGVPLDVVGPCGFPFGARSLKRAALDYGAQADLCQHDDWKVFLARFGGGRLVLLSAHARASVYDFQFAAGDLLILGRETAGVPALVSERVDAAVRIPMPGGGRCMNVTVAAGVVLAEALRQVGAFTSPADRPIVGGSQM